MLVVVTDHRFGVVSKLYKASSSLAVENLRTSSVPRKSRFNPVRLGSGRLNSFISHEDAPSLRLGTLTLLETLFSNRNSSIETSSPAYFHSAAMFGHYQVTIPATHSVGRISGMQWKASLFLFANHVEYITS